MGRADRPLRGEQLGRRQTRGSAHGRAPRGARAGAVRRPPGLAPHALEQARRRRLAQGTAPAQDRPAPGALYARRSPEADASGRAAARVAARPSPAWRARSATCMRTACRPSSRPGCSRTSTASSVRRGASIGGRTTRSAALPIGARSAERLAAADDRLARASDLIVAVNEGATERWQDRGLPAAYLPNGCDAEFFAGVDAVEPAADVQLPGPVAGFVGHLNSRTDLALLEAVAASGMSLLLIGPKDPEFEPERFGRLAERANVSVPRTEAFRVAPRLSAGDRRRPRALRRDRVQSMELSDEGARVPRGRSPGGGDVACRRCSGSTRSSSRSRTRRRTSPPPCARVPSWRRARSWSPGVARSLAATVGPSVRSGSRALSRSPREHGDQRRCPVGPSSG